MGHNPLARRDGIRDGIENSKDIEGNMGSMVSKEAGKEAAHELAAGGRDAAQALGRDAAQTLAAAGGEAVQAMASAMKFCGICAVVLGGIAAFVVMTSMRTLAPILHEWVTAKGRGSCDG